MIILTWKFSNGHEWSQEFRSVPGMLFHLHIYGLLLNESIEEVFSVQDNVKVFYKKGLS
jgi:hypothetical protein